MCISIYDPGPRSRSSPPMLWSPTPWPRIFHFHCTYSILDAKPRISMVFAPVWMENLIFSWYVQHLDAKPTYIGTKEYSYITSFYIYTHTYIHIYIYTFIHLYIYTFIHVYMYTCIHVYIYTYIHIYIYTYIHTYLHTYIHIFNHDYLYFLQDHIHRGEGGTMTVGGNYLQEIPNATSTGGGGNHDHGGEEGVPEPGTYIYIYYIYIYIVLIIYNIYTYIHYYIFMYVYNIFNYIYILHIYTLLQWHFR